MANRYRGANDEMRDALARVAPGTPLRDGIDRVVRAKAGALLVLDDGPDVLAICSGGFLVDAPYSPQRLSELAKMDGAIIISTDGSRIARANVHLVPDPTVPTSETGTRHRTAERVARSLKRAGHLGAARRWASSTSTPAAPSTSCRTSAACSTGPTRRCRRSSATRSASTTPSPTSPASSSRTSSSLRDVVAVVQRGEMVHRIADEIETMIIELGVDARLLRLQLDEIYGEIDDELDLVVADYLPPGRTAADTQAEMSRLDDDDVLDLRIAARRRCIATATRRPRPGGRAEGPAPAAPGAPPAGRRPPPIADHFGGLAKLQRATVADLIAVDGVDEPRRPRSRTRSSASPSRRSSTSTADGGSVLLQDPVRLAIRWYSSLVRFAVLAVTARTATSPRTSTSGSAARRTGS